MDANNVVLLLNELEDLGYVARRRDPDDRRRHMVALTDAGLRALSSAERAQATIEDDVLRALDPGDRALLWQLLTRALQGAEPDAPGAVHAPAVEPARTATATATATS
jgi:DNA-binding MarR family transcriptional regulator